MNTATCGLEHKKKQICCHKFQVIKRDEVIYAARMVACKQMERYGADCWTCYDVAMGGGAASLLGILVFSQSPR